jgi:hypothetical protein
MQDAHPAPAQPRNRLHGVTLEAMVRALEAHEGLYLFMLREKERMQRPLA